MRLPFLRPKDSTAPPARAAAGADPAVSIAVARTRARRRLIGALVLLAVGVVGFPVLFETQPRPLRPDMPIEALRPDTTAALKPPPAPVAARTLPLALPPADAGIEAAPAPGASAAQSVPTAQARPGPASAPVPRVPPIAVQAPQAVVPQAATPAPRPVAVVAAAAPKPASQPAARSPAAAARPDEGKRARAALEGDAAPAAAPVPAKGGRYVVQVGAYADPAMLHEARQKVEKLGLKTYTQVIEGDAGKRTRVRVGPFATRDEAGSAAARVKGAGLPANVVTL
jgi:DedD protein